MRRMAGSALAVVLVVAAGCGGGERSGSAVAVKSSAPAQSTSPPSPSPSPSVELVDIVPVLTNPPGYPACGFYTWVEDFYGQKVTRMNAAVAVKPAGTSREVGLSYQVGGINPSGASFRDDGELYSGRSWTAPGTSSRYLVVPAGPIPGAGSRFLGTTTTIVVTVDPLNHFAETNENNNVLRLQVRPTKQDDIDITDNRCTVAS